MEGFDDPGVFFSDNFGTDEQGEEQQNNRQQIKGRFREFIRQFHEGNFSYRYRYVFSAVVRISVNGDDIGECD
jgi:DNA replication licensing factor MCM5